MTRLKGNAKWFSFSDFILAVLEIFNQKCLFQMQSDGKENNK